MDSYDEYPIRCHTCNELIAVHAVNYHALLQTGISREEALNLIGLVRPCSRIAMMNPTNVTFNMENREVIEGFRLVESADDAVLAEKLRPQTAVTAAPTRTPTRVPTRATRGTRAAPIPPLAARSDEGIAISSSSSDFVTPTLIGIPVINPDPTVANEVVSVGAGYQVTVLNGRTYLCR